MAGPPTLHVDAVGPLQRDPPNDFDFCFGFDYGFVCVFRVA